MCDPVARPVLLPDGGALSARNAVHRRFDQDHSTLDQSAIIRSEEAFLLERLALGYLEFEPVRLLVRLIDVQNLHVTSIAADETQRLTLTKAKRQRAIAFNSPVHARLPALLRDLDVGDRAVNRLALRDELGLHLLVVMHKQAVAQFCRRCVYV